ncbi:MAG: PAS domain S-box protein, partial [Syntrophaceae bacterium]
MKTKAETEIIAAETNKEKILPDISSVVDSSADSIYVVDRNCNYLFMNKTHRSRFGVSEKEAQSSSYADYHSQDQLRVFKDKIEEVFRTGRIIRQEHGSKRDNLFYLRTFSPMKCPVTGKVTAVTVVTSNISAQKQLEHDLLKSENRYRNLFDNSLVGVYQTDLEGKILYVNQAMADIFGYESPEEMKLNILSLHKNRAEKMKLIERLKRDGMVRNFSIKSKARSGQIKDVMLSAVLEDDTISGTVVDITDRIRLEQEIRDVQQTVSNIFNFLPDATFAIDTEGVVLAWNRAAEEMTGINAEDIIGKGSYEYSLPFYNERRPILIDLALKQDKNTEKNYTALKRSGDILFGESFAPNLKPGNVHLSATASVLRNYRGEVVGAIESIRDSTERKNLEEEIRALSIVDHLTGLYNRRGFLSLAEQQLNILERTGKNMLLIYADLDGMKIINDTLGHQKGDEALVEIAKILKKSFRKADIIGRMGGDEFAILALSGPPQRPEILKDRLERN